MAESHKSNDNDVTFLVIVSGVVAVGIVALYHSSGCMELECCDIRPSYRLHGDVSSILIGGFRIGVVMSFCRLFSVSANQYSESSTVGYIRILHTCSYWMDSKHRDPDHR